MQINEARRLLKDAMGKLYGEGEGTAMAAIAIEKLTGYTRSDLLIHGATPLDENQRLLFDRWFRELNAWRPLQYVLGESWFSGMRFFVDERVLIPRPETEELVEWIGEEVGFRNSNFGSKKTEEGIITSEIQNPKPEILDIGTGSGCIPIALKKKLPLSDIWAIDKSNAALEVAKLNARSLNADIHFRELDVLDTLQTDSLPMFDVIVSNPPYVPLSDSASMLPHVREHEPHLALFVHDQDPLLFYRVIADLAVQKLNKVGRLFFEIHALAGPGLIKLLESKGFRDISLRKDLSGQDRMIAATRP